MSWLGERLTAAKFDFSGLAPSACASRTFQAKKLVIVSIKFFNEVEARGADFACTFSSSTCRSNTCCSHACCSNVLHCWSRPYVFTLLWLVPCKMVPGPTSSCPLSSCKLLHRHRAPFNNSSVQSAVLLSLFAACRLQDHHQSVGPVRWQVKLPGSRLRGGERCCSWRLPTRDTCKSRGQRIRSSSSSCWPQCMACACMLASLHFSFSSGAVASSRQTANASLTAALSEAHAVPWQSRSLPHVIKATQCSASCP